LVSTGASGVLILNGDLSFSNNNTGPTVSSRNVLITGSGSLATPSSDGTLDLGGVTRSIHVSTTTSGAREPLANATIETRIINGGIIKTGPRTLYLTNPNNSFSGGVEVRQGLLGFVNPGALGTGPLTFTNATGVVAGIDLGNSGGVIPNSFAASASGDLSLVYGAPVPETLEVSGSVSLQNGGLQVQVTNGTTGRDRTATLNLSGLIADGAGAQGLVKSGDGTLRLAPGNTYGGATTLKRGTLQIPDPSALGDGNLPLSIDGGCLTGTESFTMHRPVTFTANGGSLRSEAAGSIEFVGQMTWSSGTVASFGSGMTILSGGGTSGQANMLLGNPTAFASGSGVLESELGSGHVLSLRGASALPTGNLSFDRAAVLELGNADFARGLGTGASQFQMPTSIGGGWAAYGADRSVNIGGANALVTWGQVSPAFLHKAGMIGSLHLGSASGTHTLVFRNDLELNHGGAPLQLCKLVVNDGPAALDAKLAGNLQVSDPARSATLEIDGPGTLEIGGNNHGAIAVVQKGTGTTRFTGQKFETMTLERGTWIFGSHGSGMPTKLTVAAGTHLDARGLNEGVVVSETGELRLFGSITGNVKAPRLFEGNGSISGSFQQVAGSFRPVAGGALLIAGVFDLAADFTWEGAVPGAGYPQVKVDGKVILGNGSFGVSGMTGLVSGQNHIVILNGGNAPISGTFANLPEGAIIPLPGGSHALRASYRMNGDGQAFGNDFGFTVVGGPGSADRQISVSGPLAVSPGESFELNFALGNGGPETTSGNYFEGVVPVGSLFLGSTPAGTFDAPTTLRVPLADMTPGASATVTMHFQAAAQTGSLVIQGTFRGTTPGPQPTVSRAVAFLPGASLKIAAIAISSDGENLDLTIDSLPGVRYRLEGSTDLLEWETVEEFLGTGLQMTVDPPIAKEREFFRVRIVP
jgi:autotransporter-associated beta strand protein